MSQAANALTRSPADVIRQTSVSQSSNGICYAVVGELTTSTADLERMVAAVPITVSQGEDTLIADRYDLALSDNAVCHRNIQLGDSQCVFISTRLMDDKFSIAFEFFINVGHAFVEAAGVSQAFADVAWKQVESGIRGETSLDAYESRRLATAHGPDAERYKN